MGSGRDSLARSLELNVLRYAFCNSLAAELMVHTMRCDAIRYDAMRCDVMLETRREALVVWLCEERCGRRGKQTSKRTNDRRRL